MNDNVSESHFQDLPPCALSAYCLRLVDDLDERKRPAAPWQEPDILAEQQHEDGQSGDFHEDQFLERLRNHIRTCPTCTMALADARRLRAQQRNAMQDLLLEGEQVVPPTTSLIMQALHNEQRRPRKPRSEQEDHQPQHREIPSLLSQIRKIPGKRRLRKLRVLLSLVAAVAIIATSFSVFGRFIPLPFLSGNLSETPSLQPANGWSSVVITSMRDENSYVGSQDEKETVNVYDPISGKSVQMASIPSGSSVKVSHDGVKLLYSNFDGEQTIYYLRSLASQKELHVVPGKTGEMIWSTDDRYVFISTVQGIEQIDTQTGVVRPILPTLKSVNLWFYYNGYLYYSKDPSSVLHRVNVERGETQKITTNCPQSHSFWLSPGGSRIYYGCNEPQGLFVVNSDGTNPRLLRENAWPLIGYAEDGSPLTLKQVNFKYQVVKLGADEQQDHVLLDDVVPGGGMIPAANVAVTPYGRALVAKAVYADSHTEIWYGDLTTGTRRSVMKLQPHDEILLGLNGWTRIPIAEKPYLPPTTSASFSDWDQVLVAGSQVGSGLQFHNVDARSGSDEILPTGKLLSDTSISGVSPDGKNILYYESNEGKATYSVFTRPAGSRSFHTVNVGEARNAIWMPDSYHVLIATAHEGVLKVNTQTGVASALLPSLLAARLEFYRYPYLYFVGDKDRNAGALYRINIADGTVQQVTDRSPGSTFWLSPDGFTVYYVNQGSEGLPGLYAVDGDLTQQRLLKRSGVPIGFAADGELMLMQQEQGKFQVVKLGDTPALDQVIVADVAPGAVSLCEDNKSPDAMSICGKSVSLAPLGGLLLIRAEYINSKHMFWAVDLQTGRSVQIMRLIGLSHVQMIGWNKIG